MSEEIQELIDKGVDCRFENQSWCDHPKPSQCKSSLKVQRRRKGEPCDYACNKAV